KNGESPCSTLSNSSTYLMWACMGTRRPETRVELLRWLITCGNKASDVNEDGRTALHFACETCQLELVKYLITEAGASMEVKDN
ncbi:unnamed protein product, partial [Chrysoparadoxa australica]